MTTPNIRAILALSVFGVFLIGSMFIAILPIVRGLPAEAYTEHLKTFTAMYSGIVGAVVGYYFGKSDADPKTHQTENHKPAA